MILSVHVPKTAGNSFRECLKAAYGERMLTDYGDWAGCDIPEANERRASRTAEMRRRGPELAAKYDIIHGHFTADKFRGLFPRADYVAFFREPYQQTIAHYYFLLRNPQRDHVEERIFHENKMSLHDYVEWEAFYHQQSQYLGDLTIDDFTMVGISSEFQRSLAIFRTMFGVDLGEQRFFNVNVERAGPYAITPDLKRKIDLYRAADIELYRRAVEIFKKQLCALTA